MVERADFFAARLARIDPYRARNPRWHEACARATERVLDELTLIKADLDDAELDGLLTDLGVRYRDELLADFAEADAAFA